MTSDEPVLRMADGSTLDASVVRPGVAPIAAYVFAHGAGAGMRHAFMTAFAEGLATRGVATLRFQFPFMQNGSKRTDPPAVAHAAVRVACDEASRVFSGVPLFAGGKSFGGRMTSQAAANGSIDPCGLVFVGFPLHPAGQPSTKRADHLAGVRCPMLFLQGSRDALADAALMEDVVERLGPAASLAMFDDADHSFHVRKRSGSDDEAVLAAMLDTMVRWMTDVVSRGARTSG